MPSLFERLKGLPPPNYDINLDFSLKDLFSEDFGLKDLDLLETLSIGVFGRTRLTRSLIDRQYYTLKIIKKARVVKLNQLKHVQNEIKILSRLRCRFIPEIKAIFQDENSLYILNSYISGGELFSYIRKLGKLEIMQYQFILIELSCVLYHLHSLNIVFRDLKPENILLNKYGHIRLNNFSLSKILNYSDNSSSPIHKNMESNSLKTFTLCGTPEYIAPEIILNVGYNFSIDWWALGILLHEMVYGFPPFYGSNAFIIYRKILQGNLIHLEDNNKIKKKENIYYVSNITKKLIKNLLTNNVIKRYGCGQGGFTKFRNHPFFKGVDWNSAFKELLVPPLIPTVMSEGDSSNYDYYSEEILSEEQINLTLEERNLFKSIDSILERNAKH